MVAAIERGYPQREVQDASYQYARAVERKEKIIVGVNDYVSAPEAPVDVLVIDDSAYERQCEKLRRLRDSRNNERVHSTLSRLKAAAQGCENLIPPILDCVRSYATLGELCDTLRGVFGEYKEPLFD
jgi:methylmalonyl-CoA mutase N-terminal domain/subunit